MSSIFKIKLIDTDKKVNYRVKKNMRLDGRSLDHAQHHHPSFDFHEIPETFVHVCGEGADVVTDLLVNPPHLQVAEVFGLSHYLAVVISPCLLDIADAF